MILWLSVVMLGLNAICLLMMAWSLFKQSALSLSFREYTKLGFSGLIAFVADTFGVGSFAINVACSKIFGTFKDEELPGMLNGAQVLPGMIESLFFLQLVDVDLYTLFVLVAGTCLGGVLGGYVINYLGKQALRIVMIVCFAFVIFLLIAYQMGVMPLGGEETNLHGMKLLIGFIAMIVCGGLTSAGIGLFVMVQSVLFLLNVSPEVAFPIMTTAGAMQQPLTTMVFLKKKSIPLKQTWVLSLAGCLGVLISLPVFNALSTEALRSLLLFVLLFNIISMGRSYWKARRVERLVVAVA